jgi:DNA-binding helix-hairpin-helix protein with protein kinase domain
MLSFTSHTGTIFRLESQPIKRGGEGAIYKVVSGGKSMVAKIYHTPEKAAAFEKKIRFMVTNSPLVNAPPDVENTIIWPRYMLMENETFVGYAMPLVEQEIKLFTFNQANFPQSKHGPEWQKFHFSQPDALKKRMIVCYNLARAIDFLHQSGKYQLVDMKPENILVKPNGHVALIDLDSIQICKGKKLLFPSTAFTPEYAPPEFHNQKNNFSAEPITRSYDHFSLAVILYQVLMSVHPFQASHPTFTALHENIMHGLYVHGTNKNELHKIPLLHKNLRLLPPSLRLHFHKTFKKGHENPGLRTSANIWATRLLAEINAPKVDPSQKQRETTLSGIPKARRKAANTVGTKKPAKTKNTTHTRISPTKRNNNQTPKKGSSSKTGSVNLKKIIDLGKILFKKMGL